LDHLQEYRWEFLIQGDHGPGKVGEFQSGQGKWKKSGEVESGVFFQALNIPKTRFSAGAPPQTPLGELTTLPQTPSWLGRGQPIPFPSCYNPIVR